MQKSLLLTPHVSRLTPDALRLTPHALRLTPYALLLTPALVALSACEAPPNRFADLVFTGGSVLTMDSAAPKARAVAIKDGRIAFVGSDQGAERWIGSRTTVVPLQGQTLIPGFQDAHVHPLTSGLDLAGCDLTGLPDRAGVVERIRVCADSLPPGAWLHGSNWELPIFPDANPSRQLLDSLAPGRPAWFTASDGHSGWANTEALRLANLTRATPDPPNGRIERDRFRNPSGTLREAAMGLVSAVIPPATATDYLAAARRVMPILNQAGITAAQEASGNRALLEAYRALDRENGLTVRVVVAMRADPALPLAQVDSFVAWRAGFAGPRVHPIAVKIFEDGVIEARTAAMLAPYLDRPGQSGEPNWPAARLDSLVARLVEADFSVHVHAIGDRAVRLTLDAMEKAERGKNRGGRRHQIAHLEVIDSTDIPRFEQLDVIANFQALWAYPDSYIRDLTWPALGPERSRWLYPIGSVVRSGGALALGSDWNVSSVLPLEALQVAITRKSLDGSGEALLPEQAIDLMTALRGYTLGSARALGLDGETGTVTAGKLADLVVLGADLERVPPGELGKVPVRLTLVEGVAVHGSLAGLAR